MHSILRTFLLWKAMYDSREVWTRYQKRQINPVFGLHSMCTGCISVGLVEANTITQWIWMGPLCPIDFLVSIFTHRQHLARTITINIFQACRARGFESWLGDEMGSSYKMSLCPRARQPGYVWDRCDRSPGFLGARFCMLPIICSWY